jgi:branched-chain amino acid transport system ATP-binding protein
VSEPILQLTGVTRRFGGVLAVDSVDADIPTGRIVGLIGPNGAGKTTLLQLISGILKPNAGSLRFRGRDITTAKAHHRARLGIGRTFQIVQPLIGMTVIENVTVAALFGRKGHERSVAEARALAVHILQQVGLYEKRGRYMSALTLADTKRLELAKALATEPELLLLDEVMAGLNPSEVATQMDLLRAVNASGLTLIVVEHVMKAIMGISDMILVLHHGQKIAFAPPTEIINNKEVIRAYLGQRYADAG